MEGGSDEETSRKSKRWKLPKRLFTRKQRSHAPPAQPPETQEALEAEPTGSTLVVTDGQPVPELNLHESLKEGEVVSTEGAVDPARLAPIQVKDPFAEEPETLQAGVGVNAVSQENTTAESVHGSAEALAPQREAAQVGEAQAQLQETAAVEELGLGLGLAASTTESTEAASEETREPATATANLQSLFNGTVDSMSKFLSGSSAGKQSDPVEEKGEKAKASETGQVQVGKQASEQGGTDHVKELVEQTGEVATLEESKKDANSTLTKLTGLFSRAGFVAPNKEARESSSHDPSLEQGISAEQRMRTGMTKLADPFKNFGKMLGNMSASKQGAQNRVNVGDSKASSRGLDLGLGSGLNKLQGRVRQQQGILLKSAKSAASKRLTRHISKGKVNAVTVSFVKLVVVIASFYEAVFAGAARLGLQEVEKCIYGLLLMFCGGKLQLTIAVCEVAMQSGMERVQFNAKLLKRQFELVSRASEMDNQEDLNNDNIPDVMQISLDELFERKVRLFLRTCDPDIVDRLLRSFCYVVMAAIAAIQDRRIHAIVLGAALADVVLEKIEKFSSPTTSRKSRRKKTAKDLRLEEWQKMILVCALRLLCVSAALLLRGVYYRFYYAVKGATLMSKGLTELAEKNGHHELSDGYADEVFSACLAFIGLYSQFKGDGDISTVVNVFFFPLFVFVEPVLKLAFAVETM